MREEARKLDPPWRWQGPPLNHITCCEVGDDARINDGVPRQNRHNHERHFISFHDILKKKTRREVGNIVVITNSAPFKSALPA